MSLSERVPDGTGLSQAEPVSRLGPSGFDPSRCAHCQSPNICGDNGCQNTALWNAGEVAPMSKRMARFLAKPPRRLEPEAISARRTKSIRRGRPRGWLSELCELQGWACHYCKRSMSRKPKRNPNLVATLDHMLPVSRGGRNQRDNLCAACLECNRRKGSMTAEEFAIAMEARRGETAQTGSTAEGGDSAGRRQRPTTAAHPQPDNKHG